MLAYSSIAHAGYLLLGVLVATPRRWASATRLGLGALLPGGLHRLQHRGHRGAHPRGPSRRRGGLLRRPRGLRAASPRGGLRAGLLPPVAHGHPPDGGLLREVLHHSRDARRGLHQPGHHRRAQLRGERVLLPRRAREDVHARPRPRGRRRRADEVLLRRVDAPRLAAPVVVAMGTMPERWLTLAGQATGLTAPTNAAADVSGDGTAANPGGTAAH
jgi:hypothetical protein